MEIIQAILEKRDACVFWATGSGKSLCYQLPALVLGKTSVVVSPLISLMQDQVIKLNMTVGEGQKKIAEYLGSAQHDPTAEMRVREGKIAVVYVTPEKCLSNSFMDVLHTLQQNNGLALLDSTHWHLQPGVAAGVA
eukprot:g235.t1